jgi:ABC-type transport system involved in multi-copper enzyme maturation permease subunit
VNKPILRALYLDAYYQVLDNKVFRLLAVLVCALVLPTFVFGAREQGLVILFGVKTISWASLSWLVGGTHNPDLIVQRFQDIVVSGLAGSIGILFSIAATAFFVPRMLEKGAADVVFSRPVGRTLLLFARYCAGVLFVAILAGSLVLGMHLGLLLVSGRSDPAFLWSILTIVYVFALVHAVSILVGVLTRNSVAALLATILFFTLNGCVHNVWILSEYAREQTQVQPEDDPAAVPREDGVPKLLYQGLDALHFVLPKTTDADLIVRKLRSAIVDSAPIVRDSVTGTRLAESPQGLTLVGAPGDRDLEREAAHWKSAPGSEAESEVTFRREARVLEGKPRSARTAARTLSTELEKSGKTLTPAPGPEPDARLRPEIVCWKESSSEGEWSRATAYLSLGDWLLVVESRQRPVSESGAGAGDLARSFFRRIRLDENDPRGMDPVHWYERQLDWTAPLRHNIFLSIGSSILFALLVLALAAWKLRRIDF